MHDFVGRLIDDSYEKLFLDDMPIEISEIDGCIGYEELVKQYNEFQKMVAECNENEFEEDFEPFSKWIIRFKFSREQLLEK